MSARLLCESGDLAGTAFVIEKEATIGRRPDNDIVLPFAAVSSHHARIYFDAAAGCYILEDLNSYNGTVVDGVRITSAIHLHHDQCITFANARDLIFELEGEEQTLAQAVPHPDGQTVFLGGANSPPDVLRPEQKALPPLTIESESESLCPWLTEAVIQSIVDCDNLVVRNLQVSQGYHRISEAMRQLIGDKNVSWCSFATHASKTAGQALRHELMPGLLKSAMVRLAGFDNTFLFYDEVLGQSKEQQIDPEKGRLAEAMRQVSLLVSEGNIMVFAELARPFVGFVNQFGKDRTYDAGKLQEFLDAHLKPGPVENDGQDCLFEAFSSYYKARFAYDSKHKAEYILQANLLVGLHEQTRLQSQIERALAVPLDVFRSRSTQDDAGANKQRQDAKRLRQTVTRTTTQMLMSITLPGRVLKLNRDIIAPTGVDSFPADLYWIEKPRCRTLVRQFEGSSDTLTGSAADNWVNLQERMRFVVNFFRSHQQYERLFESPFSSEQSPVIESGYMPAGRL